MITNLNVFLLFAFLVGASGCDLSLRPSRSTDANSADLTILFNGEKLAEAGVDTAGFQLLKAGADGTFIREADPVVLQSPNATETVEFKGMTVGVKHLQIDLKNKSINLTVSKTIDIELRAGAENHLDSIELDLAGLRAELPSTDEAFTDDDQTAAAPDVKSVTVNVNIDLRKSGSEAAPITFLDVSEWILADCQRCHNPQRAAAGIDLSDFPFRQNGMVSENGELLNQNVVNSLTGAFGVSQMPKSSGGAGNDGKWSDEKIVVMNRWAEGGFLANMPANPEIDLDEFVGTVKVQLNFATGVSREITLFQNESAKNIYSVRVKLNKSLTTLSGKILIFDPEGHVLQSSLFKSGLTSGDSTVSVKSEVKIEN